MHSRTLGAALNFEGIYLAVSTLGAIGLFVTPNTLC